MSAGLPLSMSLSGQRIVLVGGSSGIGLATAALAVERGAAVVIAGRDAGRLAAAAQQLGGDVQTRQVDATIEPEFAVMLAGLGAIDHLCVLVPSAPDAAASARLAPFLQMSPEVFEQIFRNRFWTQCWAARYGAPLLRPGGSIVFMSNTQPRKTIANYAASCAAAGAIESLMRTLAVELAPIRVNVIAPGFIATQGTDNIPAARRAAWDRLTARQPVSRLGRPEEIAEGILFLMGSRFVTGSILDIDGGYRLT